MQPLVFLLLLAAMPSQTPSAAKTAVPAAAAQRPVPNPTFLRAVEVFDSLIPLPRPRSLTAAQARTWMEQTTWLQSLKARIRNLLRLVVAPAKVSTPAPIDKKNILALQEEAQQESLRFDLTSHLLKARHDVAMNAIRNLR